MINWLLPLAEFDASYFIDHHTHDSTVINLFGLEFQGGFLGITNHVVFMWVAGALMVLFFGIAARDTRPNPGRFRTMVEALIEFIKNELILPYMGEDGMWYFPFIATIFFFILFNNLLGLMPNGATSTGNLEMTAGLASISLLVILFTAGCHGVKGFFGAIVPSVPLFIWPMMLVIEVFGLIAKAAALAIRLFANMTGGHVVLFAILSFVVVFPDNPGVAFAAIAGTVGIYLLEIFVAFLQAFVFTFLTCVFVGEVLHPHH